MAATPILAERARSIPLIEARFFMSCETVSKSKWSRRLDAILCQNVERQIATPDCAIRNLLMQSRLRLLVSEIKANTRVTRKALGESLALGSKSGTCANDC